MYESTTFRVRRHVPGSRIFEALNDCLPSALLYYDTIGLALTVFPLPLCPTITVNGE